MNIITNFEQSKKKLLYTTIEFEYDSINKTCFVVLNVFHPKINIYKSVILPIAYNEFMDPNDSSYRVSSKSFIINDHLFPILYEPRLYDPCMKKPSDSRYCYQSEYDEIMYLQTSYGMCDFYETFYNCQVWIAYMLYMKNMENI